MCEIVKYRGKKKREREKSYARRFIEGTILFLEKMESHLGRKQQQQLDFR